MKLLVGFLLYPLAAIALGCVLGGLYLLLGQAGIYVGLGLYALGVWIAVELHG